MSKSIPFVASPTSARDTYNSTSGQLVFELPASLILTDTLYLCGAFSASAQLTTEVPSNLQGLISQISIVSSDLGILETIDNYPRHAALLQAVEGTDQFAGSKGCRELIAPAATRLLALTNSNATSYPFQIKMHLGLLGVGKLPCDLLGRLVTIRIQLASDVDFWSVAGGTLSVSGIQIYGRHVPDYDRKLFMNARGGKKATLEYVRRTVTEVLLESGRAVVQLKPGRPNIVACAVTTLALAAKTQVGDIMALQAPPSLAQIEYKIDGVTAPLAYAIDTDSSDDPAVRYHGLAAADAVAGTSRTKLVRRGGFITSPVLLDDTWIGGVRFPDLVDMTTRSFEVMMQSGISTVTPYLVYGHFAELASVPLQMFK